MSWWIPEIRDAAIGTHRIDEPEGMLEWIPYLQADNTAAVTPPELADEMAQLSTMIVFDVLIDNADRWTGNNTKCTPDQRTLYFMDNTLSFSQYAIGHAADLTRLYRIQVFPRGLIGKVRGLTAETIARALGGDDLLGPLVSEAEIRAMLSRRDHLLEYVDRLIADLGEDAVLALP